MIRFTVAAVAAGLLLAGCAATPQSIAPAYVSTIPYESFSCQQLGQEEARLDAAYQTAAGQQNSARTGDTVGVLLLGLPVSSMTGQNVAPQIASLKGQIAAVQQVQIAKKCKA